MEAWSKARGGQTVTEPGKETVQLLWRPSGATLADRDSARWCLYTGQNSEESAEWGWLKALHPDDQERVAHLWAQALKRPRFFETSCRIFHQADRFIPFHVKWVPVLHGDKSILTWAGWLTPGTEEDGLCDQSEIYDHALFQLLMEQATVGMTCRTLDGYFLRVNEKFAQIVGYTQEELQNMTVFDLSVEEEREPYAQFLQRVLLEKAPFDVVENHGLRKNGSDYWVKVTTTLLRLPTGEPYAFLSIIEDITEARKHEAERARMLADEQRLRAEAVNRENQLKAIFQSITEYVVVYDMKGDLLHANDAARQFLHIQPGKKLSLTEYIRGFVVRDVQGQVLSLEETPMGRTLRGEILPNAQAEDIIVSPPIGPSVSLSVTGGPIYDYTGKISGGISVFRDVTVQRAKEHRVLQALRALLLLVETLVQVPTEKKETSAGSSVPLIRSTTDLGEQLAELIAQILQSRYVSIASLEPGTGLISILGSWGLQLDQKEQIYQEIENTTLSDYLDGASIARLKANKVVIYDLIQQPFEHTSNLDIPHLMFAPMFLGSQLVGIFAIGKPESSPHYTEEDISMAKAVAKLTALMIERTRLLGSWAETRANEQALLEANRHFEAFLTITGHELKTPLTAMKGNINLALRRLETWSQQQQPTETKELPRQIERIQQPLERAIQKANVQERVIGELLDASQMQTNQLDLKYNYCNLTTLVITTIEQIQREVPDRTFIYQEPPTTPLVVFADNKRIKQVVSTYLFNAARRSSASRPISVHLEQDGHTVRFSTCDTGEEIAAEHWEHIWEPFYSTKQISVRYYGSQEDLGAGLYICRKIIEYHQGHTGLCNINDGETCFWFTLPLLSATLTDKTDADTAAQTIDSLACE